MPTLQCLSRDALKEYLSGWTDAEQSDAIESHLTQCSDCEQTIHALESDPETLIEFVRSSRNQPNEIKPVSDSAVAYALSRAKKLATANEEPSAPWQPPVGDFGPYELLRPLGHGGMASVYLARHRQLGKQVAIKLLPSRPFRNDHYAARFQREIRTAGQLNHPAIVSATDAGEQAGTHYLVMEYIDGLDLSRVARLNGPMPIADACAIMRTVAIGLSHAHAEGIVHRDIKPSNLMLSAGGDVKILDFGLAQVSLWDEVSAELTTVGQLMGTLDYMAPEQAERPEAVDYRADLYSIGATLFRLLCGRAPLAAAPDLSPLVKLRLLASHQPPRLDTLRTDAPEKLVEFVAQLLSRDPADRPASAAHVAEQLAQFTESADLKSLITTAQSKSQREPDTTSLVTLAPAVQAQPAASGGGRRVSRWLWAASLVPLFIFGGVLITLEMQKGHLVIESEGANVEVKLLRDGEFYEKLKITPGVNATRLYAGKYEVIIDAGSDAFSLDQTQVEITRGNTVIAHVRNTESTPEPNTIVAATALEKKEASGPLYDGKPLTAWLELFERERSPEEMKKTLQALNALAGDSAASKEIESFLLKRLPHIGAQLEEFDRLAFLVLYTCQPDARSFFELMAEQLNSKDEKWVTRVASQALYNGQSSNPNEFEPVREWFNAEVFRNQKYPNLLTSAASTFLSVQAGANASGKQRKELLDDLLTCQKLGLDFWLKLPPNQRTPEFTAIVEAKSLAALQSTETDIASVVRAMSLLDTIHSPLFAREFFQPTTKLSDVFDAVKLQVNRVFNNQAELIEIIRLRNDFPRQPPVGRGLFSLGMKLMINWNANSSGTMLGLELVDLPNIMTDAQNQRLPLLEKILEATSDEAIGFANVLSSPYLSRPTEIQAFWPELQFQLIAAERPTQSQFQSYLVFDRAFGKLSEPDRSRLEAAYSKRRKLAWFDSQVKKGDQDRDGKLSYSESQAIEKQLNSAFEPAEVDVDHDQFLTAQEVYDYLETPQPSAKTATNSFKAKQTAEPEPIYDGKTLSDWLQAFARERSPTGIGVALEAIESLNTASTADRVKVALLEGMQALGNRLITYKGERVWLDAQAFSILATCFANRKDYFATIAKQLDSANEEWARRILNSAIEPLRWNPEDVEPTVAWIEANVLKPNKRNELTDDVARVFVKIVNSSATFPIEFEQRLIKSLADCPQIDLSFWLGKPQVMVKPNQGTFNQFWSGAYASAVEGKAIEAIVSNNTSDVLVAQAAIQLSILNASDFDRKDMTERKDLSPLIAAIARRLKTVLQNPDELFAIHKINSNLLYRPKTPAITIRPTNDSYYCRIQERDEEIATANLTLELLNVASNLRLGSNLASELQGIIDQTEQSARKVIIEASSSYERAQRRFDLLKLDQALPQPATITGRECLSYMLFTRSLQMLPTPQKLEIETNEMQIRLDNDQDGSLSYEEAKAEMPTPAFVDTDKDMMISHTELLAYVTHPDAFASNMRWEGWVRYVIARYDSNQDGKLTADEWGEMAVKPEGADRNKDGVIEDNEYMSFGVR